MFLGSKQYSASIAFTLALFSHLVNHVNIRLQAELEEAESQVPPLHTDGTGERRNCCLNIQGGKFTHIQVISAKYRKSPTRASATQMNVFIPVHQQHLFRIKMP